MKYNDHLVITSSEGSPRDPKVWSGTPYNIVNGFERLGADVYTIDTSIPRSKLFFIKVLKKIRCIDASFYRGIIAKNLRSKSLQHNLKKIPCTKVLHTGTFDLSLKYINDNVNHFLFCDSTWHLWARFATDFDTYSDKMKKDAEISEMEAYQKVEHFFPIAQYVKDDLINYYGISSDRITVVGTGRGNIKPFFEDKNYAKPSLLFVAKVRFEDKGGLLLLEGFKLAQKRIPNLTLYIIGSKNNKVFSGNVKNVNFLDFIPSDDLQNLFNTSSLFAMPALNEPWGLVYLEALACKMPILGLKRNSLPEITRNGEFGFLVNSADPESIAEAIIDAFSNTKRLEEMGENGQKYCVQNFSWDRTVKKIHDVISEY